MACCHFCGRISMLVSSGPASPYAPRQFSADPPMTAARRGAASAVLADGRILVTGGKDSSSPLASAEFLSGASGGTMATPRHGHIAITLTDGRVLVAGGRTTGDAVTNAAEIYNPA